MIKRTQAIRQQQPIIILSVFDHFVGLPLKGLTFHQNVESKIITVGVITIMAFGRSHSKSIPIIEKQMDCSSMDWFL